MNESLRVVERLAECIVDGGAATVVIDAAGRHLSGARPIPEMGTSLVGFRKRPGLIVVGPDPHPGEGTIARALAAALHSTRHHGEFVLVDVSGVPTFGEKLCVARLLDTVCLLGAPRLTMEKDPVRFAKELGPGRLLGMVLVENWPDGTSSLHHDDA
jgi:hypothetical protein